MIFNKVYPDISNNSDLCIICMDENKSTITHHCPVCAKDSWKACDYCMNKLDKCPVCRTPFNPINPIIPLNQIIINININDNMPNPINQDNYFDLKVWYKPPEYTKLQEKLIPIQKKNETVRVEEIIPIKSELKVFIKSNKKNFSVMEGDKTLEGK